MKVKNLKEILSQFDDELDLYIETTPRFNEGAYHGREPGVKILLSKDILTDHTRVNVREVGKDTD